MKRRTAVLAGVAGVATAAGVGVGLWRERRAAGEAASVWSMQFDRPEGGRLALANLRGRPLLLNFWATWCPPCVAELPLLDGFARAQAADGWQVAGIAVDNQAPVLAFLTRRPVGFAIGLAGAGGVDLARRLGNGGGALPFSAVFDRRGKIAAYKLGVIAPADLQQWVRDIV